MAIKKRTKKEVEERLKEEEGERAKLPHYSMFGDDNWMQCDAIIKTLKSILNDKMYDAQDESFKLEDYPPEPESEGYWIQRTLDWYLGLSDDIV